MKKKKIKLTEGQKEEIRDTGIKVLGNLRTANNKCARLWYGWNNDNQILPDSVYTDIGNAIKSIIETLTKLDDIEIEVLDID